MKPIALLCVAIWTAVPTSCNKYDDSKIRQDIKNLQEQVASADSIIRFESYDKQAVKNGDKIELVLASSVTQDNYVGIQAEITCNSGKTTAIVTKAATKDDAANLWKTDVLNPEFGQDGKVAKNPYVVIVNAGEYLTDAYVASPSASSLKIHNSLAHVRNISSEDIARCGANKIDIASNMIWHTGVPEEGRQYMLSIMPQSIFDSGYPMKSLLEAGILTTSSTDAPCGEELIGTVPNIIGVCVTGLSPDFPNADPFNPSELISVSEALKCLTINGAKSLGLEQEHGSIEKGKYADFVVLDKDVLELEKTSKMDIFKTNVASTWFEGRFIRNRICF